MDKKYRDKLLQQLARSNMGEALKEYMTELIDKMVDARNYKGDNFEVDMKARVKAADILEKIMIRLNLIKKQTKKVVKNQYE